MDLWIRLRARVFSLHTGIDYIPTKLLDGDTHVGIPDCVFNAPRIYSSGPLSSGQSQPRGYFLTPDPKRGTLDAPCPQESPSYTTASPAHSLYANLEIHFDEAVLVDRHPLPIAYPLFC